jgi:hypothetical protein
MVIAKNMAIINGISKWLNKGETMITMLSNVSFYYVSKIPPACAREEFIGFFSKDTKYLD